MRFGPLYQDVVLAPLAEQLLAAVDPGKRGESMLDVFADAGTLTGALAAAVASDPNAQITAVDVDRLDPQLAALAPRYPAGSGTQVKVQACTTGGLPFADAAFDAAFNLVTLGWSDRDQMIGEMRRVVKPGGVIAILEYGETGATHEQIFTEAFAAATARFAGYNRHLYSRSAPRQMRTQTLREILRFHGPAHFLDVMMQARNLAAGLSSAEMVALRAEAAKRLARYSVADGTILMPIDVLVRTQQV